MKTKIGALLVLVVLALLTAGCMGGTTPDGVDNTTDNNGNSTQNLSYPPGVTQNGIQNITLLYNAHSEIVEGTPHSVNATQVTTSNGSTRTFIAIQEFDPHSGGNRSINTTKIQKKDGKVNIYEYGWKSYDSPLVYIQEISVRPNSEQITHNIGASTVYLKLRNYTRQAKEIYKGFSGQSNGNETIERIGDNWRITYESQSPPTRMVFVVNESGFIRKFRLIENGGAETFTVKNEIISGLEEPGWVKETRNHVYQ
ncbi:MAG: hypothetical protein SXQ77_02870, partial [Halobacteria archaeon]|nr:hypothetical protein [Halobacteria archaeon]